MTLLLFPSTDLDFQMVQPIRTRSRGIGNAINMGSHLGHRYNSGAESFLEGCQPYFCNQIIRRYLHKNTAQQTSNIEASFYTPSLGIDSEPALDPALGVIYQTLAVLLRSYGQRAGGERHPANNQNTGPYNGI